MQHACCVIHDIISQYYPFYISLVLSVVPVVVWRAGIFTIHTFTIHLQHLCFCNQNNRVLQLTEYGTLYHVDVLFNWFQILAFPSAYQPARTPETKIEDRRSL